MKATTHNRPHRWLAQALPNETVRIERMLFKVLRDLCTGLGVAEGDVVRCKTVSESIVLLETEKGRTIVIDQDWARFIEVGPPDGRVDTPAFHPTGPPDGEAVHRSRKPGAYAPPDARPAPHLTTT